MDTNEVKKTVYTAAELPKFTTSPATFIPTVFGGHVLVYESRSHPGHRREFAFKTRFTNQAGVSSCYYRCMSCRSMKNKIKVGPDGKLPQIPCIAVKNGYIVNDPDFPEANDHFCIPPTIEESKQKEENGFAKTIAKGRPRQRTRKPNITSFSSASLFNKSFINQLNAYHSLFDPSLIDNISLISTSLCGTSAGSFSSNFNDSTSAIDYSSDKISNIKIEEYDSTDATTTANNLLASLISSEPALRTDININNDNSNINLLENDDNYASIINSLNKTTNSIINNAYNNGCNTGNSNVDTVNGHDNTIGGSNRRKRKLSPNHFDQIMEHYVTNSWDLPENGLFLLNSVLPFSF